MQPPAKNGGITPDRAIALFDQLATNSQGTRIEHVTWQNSIRCLNDLLNEKTRDVARIAELEEQVSKLTVLLETTSAKLPQAAPEMEAAADPEGAGSALVEGPPLSESEPKAPH